jgi:hypothetical protein
MWKGKREYYLIIKKFSTIKSLFGRIRQALFSDHPEELEHSELKAYNDKVRVQRAQAESSVRMFLLSR